MLVKLGECQANKSKCYVGTTTDFMLMKMYEIEGKFTIGFLLLFNHCYYKANNKFEF